MGRWPRVAHLAVFSALTGGVFVLDTRAPLGANVPLLYIVPTLIAIWHGRSVCRALKPRCEACVVQRDCTYGMMSVYPSTPPCGPKGERPMVMEYAHSD